jgi:SecD/SecF fusion protein
MKAKLIILACIIAALSFTASTIKDTFDFKVKVVPQIFNSKTNQSGLNEAAEVIKKRLIYFFDLPQENIKLDIAETQILLTIHNIDTSKVSVIKNTVTSNNTLEFWETYENSEIIGYLTKADNLLRTLNTSGSPYKDEKNPLLSILSPRLTSSGEPLPSCMIGLANAKDSSIVNRYLKMDNIKVLFPNDLKFFWDSNPYKYDPSKALFGLHAIKVTRADKSAPLDGSAIMSAEAITGSNKKDVKISLTMNPEGAKLWAKITRENISRCIAVVYNGSVRSFPRVNAEIYGGKTEITGNFNFEEANDLVNILKSGQLPFKLKVIDGQIIKGTDSRKL